MTTPTVARRKSEGGREAARRKCHDSARRIKRDGLSRKPRLSFREIREVMLK
jgi:hypothetical protein